MKHTTMPRTAPLPPPESQPQKPPAIIPYHRPLGMTGRRQCLSNARLLILNGLQASPRSHWRKDRLCAQVARVGIDRNYTNAKRSFAEVRAWLAYPLLIQLQPITRN